MSGWLNQYRVVDLTDERGLLAGHILAKLGAEVIQVEPPGGSSARTMPPFTDGDRAGSPTCSPMRLGGMYRSRRSTR